MLLSLLFESLEAVNCREAYRSNSPLYAQEELLNTVVLSANVECTE